jgi:hypothetical protein
MPELKKIAAPVIAELTLDITKAAEGEDIDKWAFATVEVKDLQDDIVRVAGMNLAKHTDERPIQIRCDHRQDVGQDGFPVVGKVVKFVRTTYKTASGSVPAIAFGMKFAPTQFGQTMKSLYDGRYMTDFSIGAKAEEKPKPLKDGRYDWDKTNLHEISACLDGANQHAQAINRALGIEQPDLDAIKQLLDTKFTDINKYITERLDGIESAIVAKAHASEQPSDTPSDAPTEIDYTPLIAALESLKAHIPTRK